MKIYALSDTHFGHDKLVELSGRPRDFSNKILKNLTRCKGDLLIHCGDFCIGDDEEHHETFLKATAGFRTRVLVKGNHDHKSYGWYLSHGWDFVCESFTAVYFGKKYIFTHIPVSEGEGFYKNIHGHMHGNNHRTIDGLNYNRTFHFDLAPEIRNYAPVSLERIEQSVHE